MLDKILDFIYPRTCEVCKRPVDRPGRYLCSDCLMRLPFLATDGLCRRCGREAVGLDGEYLCEECRRYPPNFDRAASALRFENDARDLINAFKFQDAIHLKRDLVDYLESVVRIRFHLEEIDVVTPMPATFGHRILRGFNPCEILARALARRLGKPCRPLLRRKGHPKRQRGLSEEERRTNVIGTFAAARFSKPAEGQTVLLLDDVMTTGSTLSEAAKTLKEQGVRRVWTITLAHAIRKG